MPVLSTTFWYTESLTRGKKALGNGLMYGTVHFQGPARDQQLARACGVPAGRRSGGRLATTLVATINVNISFPLFFYIVTFSQRRGAGHGECVWYVVCGWDQDYGPDGGHQVHFLNCHYSNILEFFVVSPP